MATSFSKVTKPGGSVFKPREVASGNLAGADTALAAVVGSTAAQHGAGNDREEGRAMTALSKSPSSTASVNPDNGIIEIEIAADPSLTELVAKLAATYPSRLGKPRLVLVPVDRIPDLVIDNPYNARWNYLAENIRDLADSMRVEGQLQPGMAAWRDGKIVMIAGHYRKRAVMVAQLPYFQVMLYDNVSDRDLYLLSYAENHKRNDQTVLDNALSWARLLDDGVFKTEVEIAEETGQSKANVNKTLQVLKLDEEIRAQVEQSPQSFGLSILYELLLLQKAAGATVALSFARRVVEAGVGRSEITAARERAEVQAGRPRRRQNELSRTHRLFQGDLERGKIKEWDSGKVMVETSFASPEEKIAFIEQVRRLLKDNSNAGVEGQTED